jgi:hypothetical protein
MAIIFVVVLVVIPLITGGQQRRMSFSEIFSNQRMVLFMGIILAYVFVYPLVAFVKLKRHLNGTFEDNRAVFEKAFETLQFVKTVDTPDMIVYRRKSKFTRFMQWYEDGVTIAPRENPVVISGMRKSVTRIDRLIDQLLIRASE